MALKVEVAEREFVFDGHTLPDPDSDMSVERVREMYMPTHPEITTAQVVGPEFVDGKMRYTFNRANRAQGLACANREKARSKPNWSATC